MLLWESPDVDAALESLADPATWPDLLVVNVGLPRDGGAWLAGGDPIIHDSVDIRHVRGLFDRSVELQEVPVSGHRYAEPLRLAAGK
ncbi:hypothetical protein [Arthrobacter sp. H5]|uniref:hypothetical protein n=1 Tax=Arthrobacter sp. H5 TaxID=1267973 RepID=UPI0004804653|nr:hypothetical protein [Arthrobacter sp. H5]